jgi:hypothetical protein
MSAKYRINPNTIINPDILKNIMVNLSSDISYVLEPNVYIVNENVYLDSIKKISYITIEYLKIYKFAEAGINNINIEIYNKNLDMVMYIYYKITKYYFTIDVSSWINFYNNLIIYPIIVYNNMNLIEKNELRLSIANGEFYLNDNISFTVDTQLSYGILLKNKYDLKNNNCSCQSSNGNLYNLPTIYITTLYWY